MRWSPFFLLLALILAGCEGDKKGGCTPSEEEPPLEPRAAIEVFPESVDFGEVPIRTSPVETQVVTVRNAGTADLLVSRIAFSEDSAPEFGLLVEISEVTLRPEEQLKVAVTFSPSAEVAFYGTLLVRSNDPERPQVAVPLTGKGVAPAVKDIEIPLGECVSVKIETGSFTPVQYWVSVPNDLVVPGRCLYLVLTAENIDPEDGRVFLYVNYGRRVGEEPEAKSDDEADWSGEGTVIIKGDDLKPGVYFILPNKPDSEPISFDLCARFLDKGTAFRRGFMDENDEIDINDAMIILNYLFMEGPRPNCLAAGDTNADGRLTVSDATRILWYQFGFLPPPPEPFAECGCPEEPTPFDCESFPLCGGETTESE